MKEKPKEKKKEHWEMHYSLNPDFKPNTPANAFSAKPGKDRPCTHKKVNEQDH